MTIGQEFLKEVEAEFKASRRLVERVPSDKARWKPHPKSAALGHLTQLVCRLPKVMADIVKGIDLDLAAGPGYSFETTEKLLREFDANVAELRATLAGATDTDFDGIGTSAPARTFTTRLAEKTHCATLSTILSIIVAS